MAELVASAPPDATAPGRPAIAWLGKAVVAALFVAFLWVSWNLYALGEAVLESERFPPREAARLLTHARENIAQRIERGDMARIIARQKAMEMKAKGKARTQPDRERTAKEPPSEEPPTR